MPTYVELINGQTVTRDAKEWAFECLARWVLQHGKTDPDGGLHRRQEWLADYERRHGKPEADKLRAGMMELHRCRA